MLPFHKKMEKKPKVLVHDKFDTWKCGLQSEKDFRWGSNLVLFTSWYPHIYYIQFTMCIHVYYTCVNY